MYNLANRGDDQFIDDLAKPGVAYVPYFPLRIYTTAIIDAGYSRGRSWSHADAGRLGVAAPAVTEYPVDPGTSSVGTFVKI